MTAPTQQALCPSFIGAKRMRATLVDGCGRPVYGPNSQVVTKGFVSVEIEPEVEEGEDQSQKTAGGEQCITERGPDVIKWWNLSIEFCQVDPDLFLMMNRTWKPVTDATRTIRTGMRPALEFSDQLGFALELWPKAAGGAAAVCDPSKPGDEDFVVSGYFLLPWCLGNAPEALTLENSPTTFTLTARTRTGGLWGKGPYLVTRDAQGEPARLLDYMDPGFDVPAWNFTTSGRPDPFHIEVVTVKPPEPKCGAQPLWNSDATAPQITVEEGATTRTAVLTVDNWADIGESGTVTWGDGTSEALPPGSGGTIEHVYAADQDGVEQTITFTPGNGAAPASAPFTPQTPPTVTAVAVSGPAEATVGEPDVQLAAEATLEGGGSKAITNQATWSSSDDAVATVSKGLVHPVSAGTVNITATYSGTTSPDHAMTINPPEITSITIAPATSSVTAGSNQTYTATGQPGDQDITADTTLTVSPTDPGVTVNGQTVETTSSATAQDYTITGTYTAPSGDLTDDATLTVTAAAQATRTANPSRSKRNDT